jgi:ribosomal protein L37AE/L43A
MISQIAGRIACVFGVHQRSRVQVREIEGRLESRCKFCGTPMEKTVRSTWTVTRERLAHED